MTKKTKLESYKNREKITENNISWNLEVIIFNFNPIFQVNDDKFECMYFLNIISLSVNIKQYFIFINKKNQNINFLYCL